MQTVENKGIFIYRASPVLNRSWMIYLKDQQGDLTPVGDYTVLDSNELQEISEKKIMNLVSLLNGSDQVIELGEQTQSRLLFHRKPKADASDPTQVIFYTFAGAGVSRENAILTLEAGVGDGH
jgi:hypothetical protein